MPDVHDRVRPVVSFEMIYTLSSFFLKKRITSANSGKDEWSTYCQACVPLAIKAKEAECERPKSAKVRMVLKLLNQVDERSGSEEKTIVFSQFTSMLDLLEPFLRDEGIKYVRCEKSFVFGGCN